MRRHIVQSDGYGDEERRLAGSALEKQATAYWVVQDPMYSERTRRRSFRP